MPNVKKKLPEDEKEKKDTVEEAQETEEKEVKKEIKKDFKRDAKRGFAKEFDKDAWKPKTEIGKKVKSGEIKDIDFILDNGYNILEAEIVDVLIPNIRYIQVAMKHLLAHQAVRIYQPKRHVQLRFEGECIPA